MTSPERFVPAIVPPAGFDGPALWFLFTGFRLLVRQEDTGAASVPILGNPQESGVAPIRQQYLGYLTGDNGILHCFCGELAGDPEPPPGMVFEGLRPLYARLPETEFWLAGRAVQIVEWDRTHQFCGRCGRPTADQSQDRSKICPNCGLTNYPRLAPAIIVRVQRKSEGGPEILLARAQRFPTAMFSVLAGFVEPGETLEECVRREVREEVGIAVRDVTYFGSQPWPFPHSLMIAFTAEYAGGELAIEPGEIAEAGWFAPDALPAYPPPPSIANRLIRDWLAQSGAAVTP